MIIEPQKSSGVTANRPKNFTKYALGDQKKRPVPPLQICGTTPGLFDAIGRDYAGVSRNPMTSFNIGFQELLPVETSTRIMKAFEAFVTYGLDPADIVSIGVPFLNREEFRDFVSTLDDVVWARADKKVIRAQVRDKSVVIMGALASEWFYYDPDCYKRKSRAEYEEDLEKGLKARKAYHQSLYRVSARNPILPWFQLIPVDLPEVLRLPVLVAQIDPAHELLKETLGLGQERGLEPKVMERAPAAPPAEKGAPVKAPEPALPELQQPVLPVDDEDGPGEAVDETATVMVMDASPQTRTLAAVEPLLPGDIIKRLLLSLQKAREHGELPDKIKVSGRILPVGDFIDADAETGFDLKRGVPELLQQYESDDYKVEDLLTVIAAANNDLADKRKIKGKEM